MIETIEIPLLSLYELRDYYTALPPDDTFPSEYGASSCLIARPTNERATGGDQISIWPNSDEIDEVVGTFEIRGQNESLSDGDDLDYWHNALALAFDERMQASLPAALRTAAPMTYRECVALIEYHITKMEQEEATKE